MKDWSLWHVDTGDSPNHINLFLYLIYLFSYLWLFVCDWMMFCFRIVPNNKFKLYKFQKTQQKNLALSLTEAQAVTALCVLRLLAQAWPILAWFNQSTSQLSRDHFLLHTHKN